MYMNLKKMIVETVIIDQIYEIGLELDSIKTKLIERAAAITVVDDINEINSEFKLDKEVRKFIALKDIRSDDENSKELANVLNKHISSMEAVESKFYKLINSVLPKKGSSQEYKFMYQLKSLDSIIDKVVYRKKPILSVSDLIRGAVLFKSKNEMEGFINDLKRKLSKYIVQYDYKEKKQDSNFGYYGSHHFDLHIDGFDVELQVMPIKLWRYKETAHDIYNKWRSNIGGLPKIDSEQSKKLFRIGNRNESFVIQNENDGLELM